MNRDVYACSFRTLFCSLIETKRGDLGTSQRAEATPLNSGHLTELLGHLKKNHGNDIASLIPEERE